MLWMASKKLIGSIDFAYEMDQDWTLNTSLLVNPVPKSENSLCYAAQLNQLNYPIQLIRRSNEINLQYYRIL